MKCRMGNKKKRESSNEWMYGASVDLILLDI